MIKNILLDTDIGIDCDDAVALAVLLNLQKAERCFIAGITVSTTRGGASASVRAICGYYGVEVPPIGRYNGTPLPADVKNVYAKELAEEFGCSDAADDAVAVLRGKLASVAGRCTVVAIGPLSNIAALLRSQPDAFSPLTGVEIMREKAEALYFMGGCFDGTIGEEFNIVQDISAAQTVAAFCPVPMVCIPFESAADILTGKDVFCESGNPVALAEERLFAAEFPGVSPMAGRSSWDPVTAYLAVCGTERAELSAPGQLIVEGNGRTRFVPKEGGMFRYVAGCDKKFLEEEIERLSPRG